MAKYISPSNSERCIAPLAIRGAVRLVKRREKEGQEKGKEG